MRSIRLALVACLLLAPLSAAPAAADDDPWRHKLSAALAAALEGDAPEGSVAADGRLRVLVTGEPIPLPPEGLATRAEWNAYWTSMSAGPLAAFRALAQQHGLEIVGEWPAAPAIEVLALPRDVPTLAKHPWAVALGLDHDAAIRAQALPGGPGTLAGESIERTGAPAFWNAGFRGEGVLLAIIDTGIAADHLMLRDPTQGCDSRTVKWRDLVANRATPYDDHGHGTHVAGTAAGTKACGGQLDGVAPHARLMGVKILSGSGGGSWANAQSGLQWAFDNGAHITSNSWGGGDSADSRAVAQLVNNLARAGMPSVFAAGNSGPGTATIGWPGQADLAVTVGATDLNKVIASFSSRGPCSDGRTCPDVVAVGVSVTSSWPGGGTAVLSGTSMATPHVGGGAALILQATRALVGREFLRPGDPGVVKSELEDLLVSTAEDLGASGPDHSYGWGSMRLAPIYADILQRSAAQVVMTASIDDAVLRRGETAQLSLELRNVGGQPGAGALAVTLRSPEGATPLMDEAITVQPGANVARSATLVGDNLSTGDHAVNVTYAYTWTDPLSGAPRSRTLYAEFALRVERAEVRLAKTMPANVSAGHLGEVTLTLASVGNLPATGVTLDERIPGAYVLVPRGFGGTVSSVWSTPPPATKVTDLDLSTRLTYNVGDLAPGATWTVRYTLLAYGEGEHVHRSRVAHGDAGVGLTTVDLHAVQSVTILPPT